MVPLRQDSPVTMPESGTRDQGPASHSEDEPVIVGLHYSHRQCPINQLLEKLLVTEFVGKEHSTRSPNTCLLEFAVPLNNSVTLGKSLSVSVCFSVDGGRWISQVLYTLWSIDLLTFGNISWEKLRILGKF